MIAGEREGECELSDSEKEFQRWKRTAPALYNTVITHVLEWPAPCVEILAPTHDKCAQRREIALGRRAEGREQAIVCGEPKLPVDGQIPSDNCFQFNRRLPHKGEVNALRTHASLLATCSSDASVYVYSRDSEQALALQGQVREGFGLDWRDDGAGIASCAVDGRLAVWDLNSPEKPVAMHTAVRSLHNVRFHPCDDRLLATVGEDCTVSFFDLRRRPLFPFLELAAHTREVLCLDFAPQREFLLLTGGNDGLVKLWDIRRLAEELHAFAGHNGAVTCTQWSPASTAVFASGSADSKVCIWDCTLMSRNEDASQAGMVFRHDGHRGAVLAIKWDTSTETALLSADDENHLQFWDLRKEVFDEH